MYNQMFLDHVVVEADVVLIRIDGHLTVSKYGVVYDLWDCTQEIADVFWIVE